MDRTHYLALINPPMDVKSSVAAAVQACQHWKPTLLTVPDKPVPFTPGDGHGLAEACRYLTDPTGTTMYVMEQTALVAFTIAAVVVAFIWMTGLHHLPGFLARFAISKLRHKAPSGHTP